MNLKRSLPLTRNISYVNTNIFVSARCNSAARSLNGLGQDRDSSSTTPSEDSNGSTRAGIHRLGVAAFSIASPQDGGGKS